MSDEKKAAWGKAYDANPEETKHAAASAPGATMSAASDLATEPEDGGDGDARRGSNKHVLPGILGKQLRAAYGELLNTPVPDAIADLIKKLESAQPGQKTTKSGDKSGDEESGK